MNVVITGSDRFFLRQKAKEWVEQNEKSAKGIEPAVFDGYSSSFNWDELFEEIQTVSFFSDIKVIELINPPGFTLKNFEQPSISNTWTSLIESMPKEVILLILFENDKMNKTAEMTKPLVKNKGKNTVWIEVAKISKSEYESIIRRQCVVRQIKLDEEKMRHLMNRLPKQIETCMRELDKLALFPDVIDKKVLDVLISKPLEDNVFDLSAAVVSKDLGTALRIYKDLQVLKYDPVALVPSIAWQLRVMFQILVYKRERISDMDIRDKLGVHEYVFSKALGYARMTNLDRVCELLEMLAQLDQKIKTGLINGPMGFELFLIEAMR
ncbi:MAG: DNA polymerase III subunit delta [Firmicutes bacterium HGW-Firmicutes-10]|jgi:DNA polymerase-3 subunit delta|nr:MAG: DNA polymerase III subunit delta [Firmicutes bacterium HGW-Firmicutes-10]